MKRFIKFCLVGFSGALLQLGIAYLLTEVLKLYYIYSLGIAITIVTVWNYLWQGRWVFKMKKD